MSVWRIAALCVYFVARPAWAFVCAQVERDAGNELGPSLSWNRRDLNYTFFAAGTADIDGDEEFSVLRNAFATWEGQEACVEPNNLTDLTFEERPLRSTTDRIGWNFRNPADNENLIIFRDDVWPLDGKDTIALTTTTYKPLTGEIVDADIEFNSANFRFVVDADAETQHCGAPPRDCDCPGPQDATCLLPPTDLLNVAVHEIGHFFGLQHTNVTGATMFAFSPARDTEKRFPKCDDRNGVVFKYPAGEPNGYCDPVEEPGCTCLPPSALRRDPTITADNAYGGDGCTCRGTNPSLLALVPLYLWGHRRRRAARAKQRWADS